MTPERLMALAAARGVNLDAVSHGTAPEWTAADVSIAAAGLPRHVFYVALYALAGDDTVHSTIKTWLLEQLLEARERLQWAVRVERISGERSRFAEELVELFLAEERRPCVTQRAPEIRAVWMRVEPIVWKRTLAHQYAYLHAIFDEARLSAEGHLRKRLRQTH